jgi:hypothetical protein
VAADHRRGTLQDLAVLQEQFVAGPRTYGWADCFGGPGLTVYRFERPGQRVWVATHPERTEWWLSADSAASLAAVIDLLARANQTNQALVRELREGLVWTGSDWVQGLAAPGRAAAGPAMPQ